MALEVGTRLGHYRILGLLGRGGMADVYRAEDERLGREVALKALPAEFARDPERVERFEREVRAAARLTHPNVVTVYEYGVGADQHFYTMALMPGGDLKARIRQHPDGMPPPAARTIAAAVSQALAYAHEQGVVHRDVKPENILFGPSGTPQLTDFGIARAMSEGTRMTATGMSIGSPHYMSPEQARGQAVDGRSDLYSLGVVFHEMLTGRVPFDAADTFAVAYSHINDPAPPLPDGLAGYQPVLDRLLAKSPDDRYATAAEFASALASEPPPEASATRLVRAGGDARRATTAVRAPNAKLPRGMLAALVGGALAVALAAVGYFALRGPDAVPGARFSDSLSSGGQGPEMVVLPTGAFRMGSPPGESGRDDDEGPVRRVTIGQPFAMGRTEVTFAQWDACAAAGGCGGYRRDDEGWGRGDRPVVNVSWNNAVSYVDWLSAQTGESYRLPSEAEWEYAARAGTTTWFHWGDAVGRNRTAPAGSFAANAFGLHDMHGNVREWTADCWNGSYRGAPSDGGAWTGGDCSRRVLRGGSWNYYPRFLLAAYRLRGERTTGYSSFYVGFRVARVVRTLAP